MSLFYLGLSSFTDLDKTLVAPGFHQYSCFTKFNGFLPSVIDR